MSLSNEELIYTTLIALTEPKIIPKPTVVPYYLTFSSPGEFTLAVYDSTKHWNGTLEYSTDTTTWAVWDGTTTISSVGGKLYLRGTGNMVIMGGLNYRWVLTGTNISCTGNIENLLDYDTVANGGHPAMGYYCYAGMFSGCTALTTAPELPATTLAAYCYRSMFSGCTALTTAPELPATTLEVYCYSYMFQGCTSLTSAPALPATTLSGSGYSYMFQGCTSLTSAPALPATTLSNLCYYYMFAGCTSLTSAPALPATTLAAYCYQAMFLNCSSLKLSSTQTGEYSYAYRIPSSGTGSGSAFRYSLDSMFANTGGTFTGTPTINTTYYTTNPPV